MTRENKMMRQFNPKKLQQALIVNKKSTGYSYWDISDLSTLTVGYIYKWINTRTMSFVPDQPTPIEWNHREFGVKIGNIFENPELL